MAGRLSPPRKRNHSSTMNKRASPRCKICLNNCITQCEQAGNQASPQQVHEAHEPLRDDLTNRLPRGAN